MSVIKKFNIQDHLLHRGIDCNVYSMVIDEESNNVYFFLYNLSGQLVGYQKYNPSYEKKGGNRMESKYYNWITDEGSSKKIAVWGLESISPDDKFIFIAEGIFDVARIHQSGYPGIAVLCNDPSNPLKGWLKTLHQKKIVIYDNDKAGQKLKSIGDYCFCVDSGKDLNDLNEIDSKIFLSNCLNSIGFHQ